MSRFTSRSSFGSRARSKVGLLKRAALRFFDQLSPLDRIAIVEVGEEVRMIHQFTDDRFRLGGSVD